MRFIKLFIISVVVFFVGITAFSLLFPSHIRLSKAINIHAPADSIFSFIKDTAQWPGWHPGFQNASVGATLQQNDLSLKSIAMSDTLVAVDLQKGQKLPVRNTWQLHQYNEADSVTLQWYMDFHLRWYPWQKFSSLFFESTYGRMMEQGLNNLKKKAEE